MKEYKISFVANLISGTIKFGKFDVTEGVNEFIFEAIDDEDAANKYYRLFNTPDSDVNISEIKLVKII